VSGRSLLRLDDCSVTRFEFQTEVTPKTLESHSRFPRVSWDLSKKPEEDTYLVHLKVLERTKEFRLTIELRGVFSFDEEVSEDTQLRMANMNGPSILYGIARGLAGGITGLSTTRRYLLPSVNIVEIAERQERRRKAQSQASIS